jgi:hypothetical protein
MLREFFCAERGWRRAGAWAGCAVFVGHQVFRAWLKWAINNWYERCAPPAARAARLRRARRAAGSTTRCS